MNVNEDVAVFRRQHHWINSAVRSRPGKVGIEVSDHLTHETGNCSSGSGERMISGRRIYGAVDARITGPSQDGVEAVDAVGENAMGIEDQLFGDVFVADGKFEQQKVQSLGVLNYLSTGADDELITPEQSRCLAIIHDS